MLRMFGSLIETRHAFFDNFVMKGLPHKNIDTLLHTYYKSQ